MRWNEEDVPDQTDRVALVTGANSGIGWETARVLASCGARVVIACRNAAKGEVALQRILKVHPSATIELGSLDLASLESIRTFTADFAGMHDRIDLLVNNAGLMVPPYGTTEDGFEMQFGTNHLGHFALTGLLMPQLERAKQPRVVTVSSLAHKLGRINFEDLQSEKRYSKIGAYGQSKLANLLFCYELQRRVDARGLQLLSTASHPGWAATDLQRENALARMFNPIFGQSSLGGALPSLYAATGLDVAGGSYFGPDGFMEQRGGPKKVRSNARSHDVDLARRLWESSEKLTGVYFPV